MVRDIVLAPGEIIVDADNVEALGDEPLAEMGAKELGAAGDENTPAHLIHGLGQQLTVPSTSLD
jgi:hypothetical protein